MLCVSRILGEYQLVQGQSIHGCILDYIDILTAYCIEYDYRLHAIWHVDEESDLTLLLNNLDRKVSIQDRGMLYECRCRGHVLVHNQDEILMEIVIICDRQGVV